MKKILSVILILTCFIMLTGCCSHSQWQPATCETPKTCAECGKTDGDALGHSWVDATTETPKTCSVCGATEGKRIITDSRFTTAATADLQGNWVTHVTVGGDIFGFDDFDESLDIQLLVQLHNDGSLGMEFTPTNNKQFSAALSQYLLESLYAEFAEEDMSEADVEAAILAAYGMTAEEYVATVMDGLDFVSIIGMLNGVTGVYYVEDGLFYTGISWDAALDPTAFTLNEDTLVLQNDFTGLTTEPLAFKRMTD